MRYLLFQEYCDMSYERGIPEISCHYGLNWNLILTILFLIFILYLIFGNKKIFKNKTFLIFGGIFILIIGIIYFFMNFNFNTINNDINLQNNDCKDYVKQILPTKFRLSSPDGGGLLIQKWNDDIPMYSTDGLKYNVLMVTFVKGNTEGQNINYFYSSNNIRYTKQIIDSNGNVLGYNKIVLNNLVLNQSQNIIDYNIKECSIVDSNLVINKTSINLEKEMVIQKNETNYVLLLKCTKYSTGMILRCEKEELKPCAKVIMNGPIEECAQWVE